MLTEDKYVRREEEASLINYFINSKKQIKSGKNIDIGNSKKTMKELIAEA